MNSVLLSLWNPPEYALLPMHFGVFWEFFNLSLWVIMFTYCYKTFGKYTTIKIFGIGMIYGMVLENGGPIVVPELGFEGYFWEETYILYLFEIGGVGYRVSKVPLATHLGWCNVFFISYIFYEQIARAFPTIREGKVKSVIYGFLIITSSGLMRDLMLDPIATRFRWWTWNQNLLPVWFGVPLINYIAWFWAVGVFGATWVWLHQQKGKDGFLLSEKEQTKLLFYMLPVMWVVDTIGVMITKAIFDSFGLIYV